MKRTQLVCTYNLFTNKIENFCLDCDSDKNFKFNDKGAWCYINPRQVIYTGGYIPGIGRSNKAYKADFSLRTFTSIGEMNSKRAGHASIYYQGKSYVFGGYTGQEYTSAVEMYDKEEWTDMTSMTAARFCLQAAEHEGLIYLAGQKSSTVDVFNPKENTMF